VPYGSLMEATRTQIAQRRPMRWPARLLRRLIFDELLPHPGRMRALARVLALYQRSVQPAVQATGVLRRLAPRLADAEALLPTLRRPWFPSRPSPVRPVGAPVMRVALFSGCVQPLLYGRVHEATVRVLARNGCEVVTPQQQVCCGALMAHSGALPSA